MFVRDNIINYTEREKQIIRIAGIFKKFVKSNRYLYEELFCTYGHNGYVKTDHELEITDFYNTVSVKDKFGEKISDAQATRWAFNINITPYENDFVVFLSGGDFYESCILDHECCIESCYYDYKQNYDDGTLDECFGYGDCGCCDIVFMPIAGVYNFSKMEDYQIRNEIEIMFDKFFRKIGHEELVSDNWEFGEIECD